MKSYEVKQISTIASHFYNLVKMKKPFDFILARFKIGASGLSEISRIYGTVRLGNVFSLVCTVGTVGWYGWYGGSVCWYA